VFRVVIHKSQFNFDIVTPNIIPKKATTTTQGKANLIFFKNKIIQKVTANTIKEGREKVLILSNECTNFVIKSVAGTTHFNQSISFN
jgi:hypothetical protein